MLKSICNIYCNLDAHHEYDNLKEFCDKIE